MEPEFKYFLKIEKAYEDSGEWYVQGVASGTKEDRDRQRMTKDVLQAFVDALPLPLTDSHPRPGEILGALGEVIFAEVKNDADNSLFIKARLDKEHPAVPYMIKQIQKGKKYAFSIEGNVPFGGVRTTWSEKLKAFIDEFVRIIPKAISITSEPSYFPSLLEVVTKSYNEVEKETAVGQNQDAMAKSNLDINSQTMTEEQKARLAELKELETPTDAEKAELEGLEQTEQTSETSETAEAETSSDETQTEEATQQEAQEAESQAEVKKSVKKADEEEEKEDPEAEEAVAQSADENAEEVSKEETEAEVEKQTEDDVESAEDAEDEESEEPSIQTLAEGMKVLMDRVQKVEAMCKDMLSYGEDMEKVTKSIHDEVEVLKTLPLQKKSKVLAKTFEERKAEGDAKPKSFKDVAERALS